MPLEKRTKEVRDKIIKDKICKYQFYKVDKDGKLEFGKDLIDPTIDKPPEGYVELPPPDGLYQPKWDGDDWIDVGTAPVPAPADLVRPPTVEALQKEISDLKALVADLISNNNLKLPVIKNPLPLPGKETKQ